MTGLNVSTIELFIFVCVNHTMINKLSGSNM